MIYAKNCPTTFYCIFQLTWVPMTTTQNIRVCFLSSSGHRNPYQLENAIKSGGTVFLHTSIGLNRVPWSCEYIQTKVRGRFRKILWPSQNIWTLSMEFGALRITATSVWMRHLKLKKVPQLDTVRFLEMFNPFSIIEAKVIILFLKRRKFLVT